MSDFQNGFREGRSTESSTHSLTSFIESAFDERKVCAAAFLDIKSAFESAWIQVSFESEIPLQKSCCHLGPGLHFFQIGMSRMYARKGAIPLFVKYVRR